MRAPPTGFRARSLLSSFRSREAMTPLPFRAPQDAKGRQAMNWPGDTSTLRRPHIPLDAINDSLE